MLFAKPGYGNERVRTTEEQEGAAILQPSCETRVYEHRYFALFWLIAYNAVLHPVLGAFGV